MKAGYPQMCETTNDQRGLSFEKGHGARAIRTHLSLDKDCPDSRPIMPRRIGKVAAIPKVGGLHHRYERLAA